MVDHGILDKSDYNNDYVNKLLEINEYLTKPAFINLDNKKYLVDYQADNGYNTYAIINDDNVYGLAYDEKTNAVSIVKDKKVYIMNQEKLLQKYDEDNYLEEELNMKEVDNNKFLTYYNYLDNNHILGLAYFANGNKDVLLNYLLNNKKRPFIISLTKVYLHLGLLSLYKNKNLKLLSNEYVTIDKKQDIYSLEEMDGLLKKMNFPSFIPDDIINTYLDNDNKIKTLKRVANEYKKVLKLK